MTNSSQRETSLDLLRGLVMVLMALDHARSFFMGMSAKPTDLSSTTTILFMTRWITHFCAPVFIFLAGTGAFYYGTKAGKTKLSRFLWTRGLWLILLEFTIIRFGWIPEPFYMFTAMQVIWVIGISMVALSVICRWPIQWIVAFAFALIAGHHLLDGITVKQMGEWGWLWAILHQKTVLSLPTGRKLFVIYPFIPWVGVMAAGYAFGSIMKDNHHHRTQRLWMLGLGLTALFLLLRWANIYGDPHPWTTQPQAGLTILAFLKCSKYPPSMLFLLMTLGPAICFLAWQTHRASTGPLARWLQLIGRVPLFYYIAHLYILRFTAIGIAYWQFGQKGIQPPPHGYAGSPHWDLTSAYIAWGLALLVLTPLCRWYDKHKSSKRYPLLRYL
jgi:uncharacterized membrane protein